MSLMTAYDAPGRGAHRRGAAHSGRPLTDAELRILGVQHAGE